MNPLTYRHLTQFPEWPTGIVDLIDEYAPSTSPVGGTYAIQYCNSDGTFAGSQNATVDASGNGTFAGTLTVGPSPNPLSLSSDGSNGGWIQNAYAIGGTADSLNLFTAGMGSINMWSPINLNATTTLTGGSPLVFAGDSYALNLAVDGYNNLNFVGNSTTLLTLDPSGNMTVSGNLTVNGTYPTPSLSSVLAVSGDGGGGSISNVGSLTAASGNWTCDSSGNTTQAGAAIAGDMTVSGSLTAASATIIDTTSTNWSVPLFVVGAHTPNHVILNVTTDPNVNGAWFGYDRISDRLMMGQQGFQPVFLMDHVGNAQIGSGYYNADGSIGEGAYNAEHAIAIGYMSYSAYEGVAVGDQAYAGVISVAVGVSAHATATAATALGVGTIASADYATAIGPTVSNSTAYRLALGGYNPNTSTSESWITADPISGGGANVTVNGSLSAAGSLSIGYTASAPALNNSQIGFSYDETTHTVTVTVKESGGTVKTGTVVCS